MYKSSESPFHDFDVDLPSHLLKVKAQIEMATGSTNPFSVDAVEDSLRRTQLEAKYLASKVVHSINMASYLGILDDFLGHIVSSLPPRIGGKLRPSMIDFLDLLHPRARLNRVSGHDVVEFCKNLLKLENLASRSLPMELPLLLTDIGRIVSPTDDTKVSDNKYFIAVPRALSRVLDDPESNRWIPEMLIEAERIPHRMKFQKYPSRTYQTEVPELDDQQPSGFF